MVHLWVCQLADPKAGEIWNWRLALISGSSGKAEGVLMVGRNLPALVA